MLSCENVQHRTQFCRVRHTRAYSHTNAQYMKGKKKNIEPQSDFKINEIEFN